MRAEIQADLAEAMDGDLADAVEQFTAERTVSDGAYDPVTDSYGTTVQTFTGRWIRGSWSAQETAALGIERTDVKRTVLQNETDWVPQADDVVNGLTVMLVSQDGALATWKLQLRRT